MPRAAIPFRAGAPRSKSPKGVDQLRRVNTAYMPDERDLIEEIARLENRTASSTVRNLVILGARAAYPDVVARILKSDSI